MENQNEYIRSLPPFDIYTIDFNTKEEIFVASVNKEFLGKIVIDPTMLTEDILVTPDQSIHTSQLFAHAELFSHYADGLLEKFCAKTRLAAKEANPKLTVGLLQDTVICTEEYTVLRNKVGKADFVVSATKGLYNTVSRVKVEMLKTASFANKER